MEAQLYQPDSWTMGFNDIEIASDYSRAVLKIGLMHVGANKKNLYWTPQMLERIAPMFRSCAFRYDLDGQEGSSHTTNKLSSPHFDVGWTYKGEEGAWYDSKEGTLYVKGEVTHPQVIQKLSRMTTDGQREINFASMGVIVEKAICSICGAEFGTCDHERGRSYNMDIANKVPTEVSKALHVALTNDPADGEAEIDECIFQELNAPEGKTMLNNKNTPLTSNPFKKDTKYANTGNDAPKSEIQKDNYNQTKGNVKTDGPQVSPNDFKNSTTTTINTPQHQQAPQNPSGLNAPVSPGLMSPNNSQIPGGLATSSPQTAQPGSVPSSESILKDLAERVKTIEQKYASGAMATQPQSPELINDGSQTSFTQDNMGTTQQFDQEQGGNTMDIKQAQNTQSKAPLNPGKAPEMQDAVMGQPATLDTVVQLLQQILAKVSQDAAMDANETQDMGKESMEASKGIVKKAQENIPMEHMGEGAVASDESDSNKKNKQHMQEPGKVATADMSKELADMKAELKMLKGKLEIQDNDIPEFGGSHSMKSAEVADMSASQRREKFGQYGAFDAIFKGKESASRFNK